MKIKTSDIVSVEENKNVQVFSQIFASSKFSSNIYGLRIMDKMIQYCQNHIKNIQFKDLNSKIEHDFDNVRMSFPIADIGSENATNYEAIKEGVIATMRTIITFEDTDNKKWSAVALMEQPEISKGTLSFNCPKKIFDAILDFTKGWRIEDIKVASSLKSYYARRFHMMFSQYFREGETEYTLPHPVLIQDLRQKFGIGDEQYKRHSDFDDAVMKTAQKELNEKANITFEYTYNKEGRKFVSINFTIKRIFRDLLPVQKVKETPAYKLLSNGKPISSIADLDKENWQLVEVIKRNARKQKLSVHEINILVMANRTCKRNGMDAAAKFGALYNKYKQDPNIKNPWIYSLTALNNEMAKIIEANLKSAVKDKK